MSEKIKMRVEMEVTISQALALQAMFEYWNHLSSLGSSRYVAFYVDGDGNFRPACKVLFSEDIPSLTSDMAEQAVVGDNDGNRTYDFDAIAWGLQDE